MYSTPLRTCAAPLSTASLLRPRLPQSRWITLAKSRALDQHASRAQVLGCARTVRYFSSSPVGRNASSSSSPKPESASTATEASGSSTPAVSEDGAELKVEPKMAIAFTCKVPGCGHRQAHTFSKRSYETGIVIITCSNCQNRHLIADHIGWFKNLTNEGKHVTIEELARMNGDTVQRGKVDANGVYEYTKDTTES